MAKTALPQGAAVNPAAAEATAGVRDANLDAAQKQGQDAHEHRGIECCGHHEVNFERWIILYLIGGVLVFTTTLMSWFSGMPEETVQIPAMIGSVLLGGFLVWAAISKELLRGRPSTSSLAALAIVAAIAIGAYESAGYLALILLVFDQALRRTAWGAQRAIEDLIDLTPDTARLVTDAGEREVGLDEVKVGDVVRVRAGENLPVDGVVTSGTTTIDASSLTGEALPVEVKVGDSVFAGSTNLTGTIELRATSVGADTTIGKVAELIREAESSRTPRQQLIEQVARFFVPVALTTCLLVAFFTRDIEAAIAVLVVVCPSALLISSPTAMMAAFAASARLGIMIKQVNYLEAAANVDTVVFDKTGTLTTGRFAVSRLAPADGVTGADLLKAAADAEQHSNHPLAKSIMHTAQQARVQPDQSATGEEIHGAGVRARTAEGEILAGRPSWLMDLAPHVKEQIEKVEKQIEGMSGVHVMRNGKYLGAVGLEDKLRYNAKGVVDKLRDLGTRTIAVLTGDRFAVAKRVGMTVGVDRIEAECLPEEKHDIVRALTQEGRSVLMVGDGINDGPSLAAADVGVAMGLSGSDIATNSAGVALMTDDISRVPFLIELARRTRGVITQNIAASIVIALIGLVIAASGGFTLLAAALYHFVGDVFVLANSFRLIRFGEDFAVNESQSESRRPAPGPTRPGTRQSSATMRPPAPAAAAS